MNNSQETIDLIDHDIRHEIDAIRAEMAVDRVVFPLNEGEIRNPLNGARLVETDGYPSKRYRRSFSTEASVERKITHQAEVLTNYIAYRTQPLRIEVTWRGKRYSAIPDAARVMIGRIPELIEAKYDFAAFDEGKNLFQRAISECGAEALGWDYTQLTHSNLGNECFIENVTDIQYYRFNHVTLREQQIVNKVLRRHDLMLLGDLADEISSCAVRGQTTLYAMMVRRLLSIDLNRPLSRSSIVRRAPDLPQTPYRIWLPPHAK